MAKGKFEDILEKQDWIPPGNDFNKMLEMAANWYFVNFKLRMFQYPKDLLNCSDWDLREFIIDFKEENPLISFFPFIDSELKEAKKGSKKRIIKICDILNVKSLNNIQAGIALCQYPEEATSPADKSCLPLLVSDLKKLRGCLESNMQTFPDTSQMLSFDQASSSTLELSASVS